MTIKTLLGFVFIVVLAAMSLAYGISSGQADKECINRGGVLAPQDWYVGCIDKYAED